MKQETRDKALSIIADLAYLGEDNFVHEVEGIGGRNLLYRCDICGAECFAKGDKSSLKHEDDCHIVVAKEILKDLSNG